MAILSGDLSQSNPRDIRQDAMLSLQAISRHVKGCAGSNAVAIPVQISRTTTTRDGFGTIKNSETTQSEDVLNVRPEFASWARANITAYPPQPISTVRSAVLDLISQEGCDGAGFRQLETGLAKVIGVSLPAVPFEPPAPEAPSGSIPATADGFVAHCFALQKDGYVARGLTISDRSVAQICFCMEHAAREMGDAGFYNDLKVSDTRQLVADPGLLARFQPPFDQCFQAAPGSELRTRVETLWREMNI